MQNKGVHFNVSKEMYKLISDYSHFMKMNKSEFIRFCINHVIEDVKTGKIEL